MKILIMKYLLLLLLFLFDNINAQNHTIRNDSVRQAFYQEHRLFSIPFDYRAAPLFDLKVFEVDSFHTRFSDGLGFCFGYCGDIEGGIKNLLQKDIFKSTSHVQFLNKPKVKKYVLFYGIGDYLMQQNVGDTSTALCYSDDTNIRGREIILRIMSHQFNFEIKEIKDSLEGIELRIKDSLKLNLFLVPYEQRFMDGTAYKDDKTGEFQSIRSHLWRILQYIGTDWNTLIYDETNTDDIRYSFTIPSGLLDSPDKYVELNNYLEQHLGLTLVKAKRVEKIFTIEFKNK